MNSKGRIDKSKTRWVNVVQNKLKRTGVKNWRQKTKDRIEWQTKSPVILVMMMIAMKVK